MQHLPVEILLSTAAKKLELDDNGAIRRGPAPTTPAGSVHITAPVVILQCGGFGKSDEKLREFAPWFFEGETPIHRFSVPTDTGDGIDMLRELGVEPTRSAPLSPASAPSTTPSTTPWPTMRPGARDAPDQPERPALGG